MSHLLNGMADYVFCVMEFVNAGGMVMIPLLAVSSALWVLVINRVAFFRRLHIKNISRHHAGVLVKSNQAPAENETGVNARLVREFLMLRSGNILLDASILDETVMRQVRVMDHYLVVIQVLAAIAPLLGLLGTVTGMITTFDVITVFGTGNARAMAGGISEALITTQTGLLISIPGLYMSGFLNRRAENLKQRIAALGIYLKRFL